MLQLLTGKSTRASHRSSVLPTNPVPRITAIRKQAPNATSLLPQKNYSKFHTAFEMKHFTIFSTLVTRTVPQSFYLSQKCIFPAR